jgi:hypothetical protein
MVVRSVAVPARDQRCAPAFFLGGRGGGQKVVGFVAGRFRIEEAARGDELRQSSELVHQSIVEFATGLVIGERLVTVGFRFQRVPRDEHRARLLREVEPQQEIREADDGARLLPAAS